jgi:hypothetical protein
MTRAACPAALAILLVVSGAVPGAGPGAARAEGSPASFDKVLLQLNWGDDNLLIGSGETRENSPEPNFGRCARTRIDGLPAEDCARGSTRLGLYKDVGIGDRLTAEGALVVGLGLDTDPESSKAGQVSLFDLGSYLRIGRTFGATGVDEAFVELFPVDARPLRLGFHPELEWGTKDEFPKNFRRGQAPGVKLGARIGPLYAFAGAKSALVKSPLEVELESDIGNQVLFATRTYYGVLGGLGVRLFESLTIEANGGFFHKGTLTKEGVLGRDLLSGGGSVRVGFERGLPIGLRIDSGLYERAASGPVEITPAAYDRGQAFAATAEASLRVQSLADFESPGSTDLEEATAGHAGAKLRLGDTRIHAEGRLRSLTWITAEVPGFFPYATLPATSETSPELQALGSVDHRLGDVTLALTAGLRFPATYRGLPPKGTGEDPASAGIRTVVVGDKDAGGWSILPEGQDAVPVFWVEAGVQWSPAKEFAVLGEVLLGRDENRTQVERNEEGHALRVFTQPNVLAVNVLGQFVF